MELIGQLIEIIGEFWRQRRQGAAPSAAGNAAPES